MNEPQTRTLTIQFQVTFTQEEMDFYKEIVGFEPDHAFHNQDFAAIRSELIANFEDCRLPVPNVILIGSEREE